MEEKSIVFNEAELFALQEMIDMKKILNEPDDIRKTVMLAVYHKVQNALEEIAYGTDKAAE